ncbi:hypothetical protein AB0I28_06605 [Phytomonospora sp. NPDC050363]|uniref:hypothetical protein n=1 Tax=Phytomonospora sp. NPDC050363 TaxID=3155642 RepID=UPI0033D37B60
MNDDVTLLRQTITQGEEVSDEIVDRLGDRRVTALISAALAEAARRRFTSASLEEIKAYADNLLVRFRNSSGGVKPLHAELLIRAAITGDPSLIEPLSGEEVLSMCFLLVYAIMSEEKLDPLAENAYIDGVIAEADSY